MSTNSSPPNPEESRPAFPTLLPSARPITPPDQPIPLYSGEINFTQGPSSFKAEAHIALEWLPSPRIRFHVPRLPDGVYPPVGNYLLQLPDGTPAFRGFADCLSHPHMLGIVEDVQH
jgi:hypothetical protein